MGIGDPEDLTGAVVLLCGEAGRFITGTDIRIDGALLVVSFAKTGERGLACGVRWVYDVLSAAKGLVGWLCGGDIFGRIDEKLPRFISKTWCRFF